MKVKTAQNEPDYADRYLKSYFELSGKRIIDRRSRKGRAPAQHPWRQYRKAGGSGA